MARDFAARTDIDNTDPTNYPDGRLKDSFPSSAKNGTALDESLMGDIWQFFLRLTRDSGVTENGLPDNVTNGFQLEEALRKQFIEETTGTFTKIKTAVVAIGTWDMDTDVTKIVAAPSEVTLQNLIDVQVTIRTDSDASTFGVYRLDAVRTGAAPVVEGGVGFVRDIAGSIGVDLYRTTGGLFDGVIFDSTVENRGFVMFTYQL